MPDLPVSAAFPALRRALAGRTAAVLCAPPGSGKTTLAPLALLDEPWLAGRKILLLEPRRMAARAAAWRMSDLAGSPLGGLVGYHVRLERKASRETRIEVLTEGLLSRRILADPELAGTGLVVFDEFHERSLHADFGLALALDVQRGLRPDLRLLVMSATLDADRVAMHIGGGPHGPAPVVRADGRLFPVETAWLDLRHEPDLAARAAAGVRRALAERRGSVLAFLPGEGEIRAAARLLGESRPGPDVDLMPLYASLPRAEQDAALRPSPPGRRKVVLATSIAESSLTIDGVESVVDCGLARVSRFSPDTGMSHLETVRETRDRADQRRGRAGRLGPGFCLRLWSEEEDRRLAPAAPPEILQADLAPVALAAADWGSTDPAALPWPTPPPRAAWNQALALLRALGALDAQDRVTPHGRDMARLGAHPRLAHMMLAAPSAAALREACLLAAALSENLPASARPSSNAEHLVGDLERGGGAVPAPARARIRELAAAWERQIGSQVPGSRVRPADPRTCELGTDAAPSTGCLLSFAWPDRLARRRTLARDDGRYRLAGGRGAKLAPGDGLARHEWIVVADVDDADADGAIRLAAPIAAADVERLFGGRARTARVLAWNDRLLRVDAVERVMLGEILWKERPLRDPDPEAVLACLCRGLRAAGIGRLGWTDAARALQARAAFARRALPEENVPDLSDEALAAELETWLGPRLYGLSTLAQAAAVDLVPALEGRLGAVAARLAEWAPSHLAVASGSRIRIDYAGAAPTASVRLQECFGMLDTPRVARGRVPVRLQLLSPAMRPVQITDDLASFWREGYPEVRKELRGRYPRHEWPEDPVRAAATRRAKPRK
ncbi:MAG: ATP-dependent helicase HrpB [Kiritimatiellae bacterium]|nr:ATP-dependent helicase HrpB [Kiritimatiellia bacterium]